ncbi:terminase small subunit [Tetraselmis viridis virus SI1]|uniref:terminase small subunit n=1 Tax=Tetraselmis viridis virus S20 TaxID=754070 RepID=UPI0002C0E05A|nr:terminase small subunit [Tetraselmis viridis virus S20]AGH31383.1 hypothetical protein TVGG_00055 [Tetraselmis viridis virus S20]AGH31417.1 terminase small subunit [Tetraselmis viridis virus SI1]
MTHKPEVIDLSKRRRVAPAPEADTESTSSAPARAYFSDMPERPDYLEGYAAEEWDRVAEELFRFGQLTNLDVAGLAAYCVAFDTWHRALDELELLKRDKNAPGGGLLKQTDNGNLIPHPLIGVANKSRADMVDFAKQFGLTPYSRQALLMKGNRKK